MRNLINPAPISDFIIKNIPKQVSISPREKLKHFWCGVNKTILAVLLAGFLLPATSFAYSPTLSLIQSGGDNVTVTVNGDSYAAIELNYTLPGSNLPTKISNFGTTNQSGYFSTTISASAYGLNSGAQVYVVINGQQSPVTQLNSYGGGCGYYGCGSGGLTFSQNNINLAVGQTVSVTANYYSVQIYPPVNNLYISSNSNSYVASASLNGNTINVTGNQLGSTTITVCVSGSNQCGQLYVTVSGGGGSSLISFSNNNPSLSVGQSMAVYVYGNAYYGNTFYISSNSNLNAVTASISGSSLNLYGQNAGNATITVCQSSGGYSCGTLYVTVSGVAGAYTQNIGMYDDYFSPSNITVSAGTTVTWTNYGSHTHIVTADNGSFNSGSLMVGQTFSRTFNSQGTYRYYCNFHGGPNGSGMSGTITVTGGGSGSGSLWFNPSNPTMYTGQSLAVSVNSSVAASYYPYSTSAYYVSSNSNPGVVSANISGTVLNLYANQAGSSNITVCHSSLSFCGTLYVAVSGSGGGGVSPTLWFSQNNPNLSVGQNLTVSIYSSHNLANAYINSNSNPSAVSVSQSGSTLYLTGRAYGSSTISVCLSGGSTCANLYVTVYGGGGVLGTSTYSNGQLISEAGTVYIVYKNTKIGFASAAAFTGLGFSFNNVVNAGFSGLAVSGYVITTSNASHPWGSWVKSGQTVYFVHELGLIPVPDWNTFLNNGGNSSLIVPANLYDFQRSLLSVMVTNDSRLK